MGSKSVEIRYSIRPHEEPLGEIRPGVYNVLCVPKADAPTIRHADKWNPLWWAKNADDPTPPEGYRPDDPGRETKWRWRNPCHNFTFYVIGIADKAFIRTGRHPDSVFAPNSGWNVAVSKRKCYRLPFISHKGKRIQWYIGWRNNGNFGIKFQRSRLVEERANRQ